MAHWSRRILIPSFACFMLLAAGACGKPATHKLSADAADPYGALDDAKPSTPDADASDEDQLLDRLFRDSKAGKAPRRQVPGATPTTPSAATTRASTLPAGSPAPSASPVARPSSPVQPDLGDGSSNDGSGDASNGGDDSADDSPADANAPASPTPDAPVPVTPAPDKKDGAKPVTTPASRPAPQPAPTLAPAPPKRPKPRPAPTAPSVPKATTAPKAPKPNVGNPAENARITALWDERVDEGTHWTNLTIHALSSYGRGLLKTVPSDIQNFCPNYAALGIRGRAAFWVKLISAIAAAESHFDPKDSYTEKAHDRNGDNVVSRGLLQLSLESVQAYDCGIDSQADLEDPQKNIECSVKILEKWVVQDGVVSELDDSTWLGGARYWSTLRPYNNKFETIRQLVRKSAVCRAN